MFRSTKKLGPISTSHRNWMAEFNPNRNSKKCAWCHGYSRYIEFTFDGELDSRQWVMDFGDLKYVKKWLEENWDHKTLVASNDPKLDKLKEMELNDLISLTIIDVSNEGWGPGIEGSCVWVYDSINPIIMDKTKNRVQISKIQIWEHEQNSAIFIPERLI